MSVVGIPGYKESNLGWIPQDWMELSLGEICKPQQWPTISFQQLTPAGYPVYGANGQIGFYDSFNHENETVAVTCRGATCGSLTLVPPKSYITGNAMCLDEIDPSRCIGHYLYQALVYRGFRDVITGSAQPQITGASIRKVSLAIPPLPEQQKIAAILTAVDDKLDLIARQIEATQALKQGLMRTLFSRGVGTQGADGRLVPHTEFKDSELGEIPIGWDVRSLASLSESITVGIATSTTEHYVRNGVPLVRNQNIKEDYLDLSDLLMIAPAFDERNKSKRVKAGDILTVRTGYPGVSCVVPEGLGSFQTFTTLITRPKHEVLNAHYASRYFNSPEGKMRMLHQAAGGAQQNINAGNLKKLQVPLPPLVEQEKIAAVLRAVESKTRALAVKRTHFLSIKRGLMQKLLTGEWRVKLDAEAGA